MPIMICPTLTPLEGEKNKRVVPRDIVEHGSFTNGKVFLIYHPKDSKKNMGEDPDYYFSKIVMES